MSLPGLLSLEELYLHWRPAEVTQPYINCCICMPHEARQRNEQCLRLMCLPVSSDGFFVDSWSAPAESWQTDWQCLPQAQDRSDWLDSPTCHHLHWEWNSSYLQSSSSAFSSESLGLVSRRFLSFLCRMIALAVQWIGPYKPRPRTTKLTMLDSIRMLLSLRSKVKTRRLL